MKGKRLFSVVLCFGLLTAFAIPLVNAADKEQAKAQKERLGKLLFFDTNLSTPEGQSCASCHAPETGFTGIDPKINEGGSVYEGAAKGRFGNRKPPASSYGGDSPVLHYDKQEKVWIGGMFWDGRATGAKLKDPLAEQAQGPFLNPLEQNIPDEKTLCLKVQKANYAPLFEEVWGKGSFNCDNNAAAVYAQIGWSIAAYERSAEVNPFSSKFDYWLRNKVELSAKEKKGLKLFNGKGKCAECHLSAKRNKTEHPLFTDFTYDNLGIPKNPQNPYYAMPAQWNPDGKSYVDQGLGGFLKEAGYQPKQYKSELGKFKVPTLRNVDKRPSPELTKAYGHNGYFKSLKEIVHFYNTRDVLGKCETIKEPRPAVNCWPEPEVKANINKKELGNLRLSEEEEDAIVAFMQTLSDNYAAESQQSNTSHKKGSLSK